MRWLSREGPHGLKKAEMPLFGFGYLRSLTREPSFWEAEVYEALPVDETGHWPQSTPKVGLHLGRVCRKGLMQAQWSPNNPDTRRPHSPTSIRPVLYYRLSDPECAYDVLVEESLY